MRPRLAPRPRGPTPAHEPPAGSGENYMFDSPNSLIGAPLVAKAPRGHHPLDVESILSSSPYYIRHNRALLDQVAYFEQ